MTKEQCREAGATMIAWADGKSIQYRRRNQSEWFDIEPACTATTLSWDWDEFEYRVKPMPKLRPWTADEVPARACRIIERELNAANARIRRLDGRCQALDDQLSNLLEICRQHGVDVSSQDMINGRRKAKEAKP